MAYYMIVDEQKSKDLIARFNKLAWGSLQRIHKNTPFSYTHVHRLLHGKSRMNEASYKIIERAVEKEEKVK